jgi:hypothetical protein
LLLSWLVAGCSGSNRDDSDANAALNAQKDTTDVVIAPQVQAGDRYWDAIGVVGDPEFDGVIAIGRRDADGDPVELVFIERKTGAIGFLNADGAIASSWDDTKSELDEVSQKLMVMAGDPTEGDTRTAGFQDFVDEHACAIRLVALGLSVVGVIVAADLAIAAAPAVIAAVETQGIRTVALAAARTAIASPRIRTLAAIKVVKWGVKGWLLFSDAGQRLTAPAREAFNTVLHKDCSVPGNEPPTDGFVGFP